MIQSYENFGHFFPYAYMLDGQKIEIFQAILESYV